MEAEMSLNQIAPMFSQFFLTFGGPWALLFGFVSYVYFSLTLQIIANKTNTPYGWFAWFPMLSGILIFFIAKKSLWWLAALALLLIPLLNILVMIGCFIFMVILYMDIAEAAGHSKWWGLAIIIPGGQVFLQGYLAFSGVTRIVVLAVVFLVFGITSYFFQKAILSAMTAVMNLGPALEGSTMDPAAFFEAIQEEAAKQEGLSFKSIPCRQPQPVSASQPAPAPRQGDADCALRGILYFKDNPVVMVGEDSYSVNESVCGGTIVAITPSKVTFQSPQGRRDYDVGDTIR